MISDSDLHSIFNSQKLTDVQFMTKRLMHLSDLRKLLNFTIKQNLGANRKEVISLLLSNSEILENLCSTLFDVNEIVKLLPEAKDALIKKISKSPTILSKYVQNGGFPNLRPLFEISQLVSQRTLILSTLLNHESLLLLSLQRIDHLMEMIYTLTKTAQSVMPTILANNQLLRRFLKEDFDYFIKPFLAYKNEVLSKILNEDVLFREQEDLVASTLQELGTYFPEHLEAITQKCKMFNEKLFTEILQTNRQVNNLFLPERFNNAPLSAAVFYCEKEKTIALIQNSNHINVGCTEGYTALHWACMRRDEAMISELMIHGADPGVKNNEGKTPLEYYCYQIRINDFSMTLNYSAYRRLKETGLLELGSAEMKEFNLVFWNDAAKEIGAVRRNQKQLKMDLFTTPKKPETNQLANIATKPFIASPVFAKKVTTPLEHVTKANFQGYKQ